MMVRFGQLSAEELAARFPDGVPEWADRSVTGALDVQQVSVFDEAIKCHALHIDAEGAGKSDSSAVRSATRVQPSRGVLGAWEAN